MAPANWGQFLFRKSLKASAQNRMNLMMAIFVFERLSILKLGWPERFKKSMDQEQILGIVIYAKVVWLKG